MLRAADIGLLRADDARPELRRPHRPRDRVARAAHGTLLSGRRYSVSRCRLPARPRCRSVGGLRGSPSVSFQPEEPPLSDLSQTDALFYDRTGMDPEQVGGIVREALSGMDDGELFLEYSLSEGFSFDDGKLKSAAFDTAQGFGLRGVSGEATGFAHSGELSEAAIRRAGETVKAVREGRAGTLAEPPRGTNASLYTDANPLNAVPFETKVRLLAEMDSYARGRDPRVRQVMCSLSGEWRAVQIVRPDGVRVGDIRPLVRLNVTVVVGDGDRQETGSSGAG